MKLLLLLTCLIAIVFLPSCGTGFPLTGQLLYRDPGSGTKGGLTFEPGHAPEFTVQVPIYEPKTGELIGKADLHGPLAGQVMATK